MGKGSSAAKLEPPARRTRRRMKRRMSHQRLLKRFRFRDATRGCFSMGLSQGLQNQPPGALGDSMESQSETQATGNFPRTRWTLVQQLRQEDSAVADRAMEVICRAYWRPLYVYAR